MQMHNWGALPVQQAKTTHACVCCRVQLPRGVPVTLFSCQNPQRKPAVVEDDSSEYEVVDEKAELEEVSEDDEKIENDGDTFRLGQQDDEFQDFSSLALKEDAHNRWVMLLLRLRHTRAPQLEGFTMIHK